MSRRTDARNGSEDSYSTTTSVDRRTVLRSGAAGAAAIGGMALAGCIGGGGEAEYQVSIISSPAGFGDNAFNDNALSGLEEAAEDYDIDVNTIENTNEGEYGQVQADTAETGNYDLIVMVGDQHTEPLGGEDGNGGNAAEYPDQNWMLINDFVEADNVAGTVEANHEMSFLAGVGAATLTQEDIEHADSSTNDEDIVGAVGGQDIDLINAFITSYEQGVEWVSEDIEVRTAYSDSFSDPSGVEDAAASQFDDGADIVWHAAAAAGEGAFSAADSANRFALGVDSDQSQEFSDYEDVILGSATKALDEAAYTVAEGIANDDWESVQGQINLTTEGGEIDWVTGVQFEDTDAADAVDSNIEDAKSDIIDGNVDFECGPTGCE